MKLSAVDFRIDVTTIKRMYEDASRADIYILNEYDQIINDSAYLPRQTGLKGLWELKGRKVFAFSATSSMAHERLLSNCVEQPQVVSFMSEYEQVKGASPIVDPVIRQCGTYDGLRQAVAEDLTKLYE